jgi:hypothetical protein
LLKPTIKEKGLTKRERYLSKLSEKTFFGLWSFPNVYTDEGITKLGIGKELCDLLVVFQNKLIIFSDKDIAFNSEINLSVAWKRWFKRAVVKSGKQLYGAESWLRNHSDRVFLDKECKTKFPIPLSDQTFDIHLIAVTSNTVEPAAKHWGGGSSGTLYQIYPLDHNDCLEKPFMVGDLFPCKTFLHVLDELSLDLLMAELNTISDFIGYLEDKEKIIRGGEIIQSAGEEELLAHYFRGRSEANTSGKMIHPTGNPEKDGPISLSEGLWCEYIHEQEYEIYSAIYKKSEFWDSIIRRFSQHILQATVGRGEDLEFEYHERAVRHLAAENRFSRYLLSNAFNEKFLEVPPNRRSSRLVFSPTQADKLYIFLFLPRDEGQDYEDYREERLGHIEAYALVSKYLNPIAQDVVVLATEPQKADGRSEDIFYIEFDKELSIDGKQEAERLIKEERILNDVWKHRNNPFMAEDPNKKPYRNKKAKYEKNERCPCGSTKKYKKCCM